MNSLTLPTPHYSVDDAGLLYVHGIPTKADFEAAWTYLCHIRDILPRVMGNMLAHAKDAEWGGPEYITELLETPGLGRSRNTLYQYHSTYSRLPAENQRPGIRYTYDREVARLPVEQQAPMLDRIERGDFDNSDQLIAAVRQAKREPAPPTYNTRPRPLNCPFCNENGLDRERLHWSECPHCHAHGDELLDRFAVLLDAVRRFTLYGELDGIVDFCTPYKNGWQEEDK